MKLNNVRTLLLEKRESLTISYSITDWHEETCGRT